MPCSTRSRHYAPHAGDVVSLGANHAPAHANARHRVQGRASEIACEVASVRLWPMTSSSCWSTDHVHTLRRQGCDSVLPRVQRRRMPVRQLHQGYSPPRPRPGSPQGSAHKALRRVQLSGVDMMEAWPPVPAAGHDSCNCDARHTQPTDCNKALHAVWRRVLRHLLQACAPTGTGGVSRVGVQGEHYTMLRVSRVCSSVTTLGAAAAMTVR